MKLILGIVSYLLFIAAIVGGGTVLVSASRNQAAPVMARGSSAETPPRIQAWLDRKAEVKDYEERARVAAIAEAERAKEIFSRKLPTIAEQAAMVKAREGNRRDVSAKRARSEARREAARLAQRRAAEAARRAPRDDAEAADMAQGLRHSGFAQASDGGYGRTAYDVVRDRGGL